MGAAMFTAGLFQVLIDLCAAVAVFPVAAGLAEAVAVTTLIALGAVAVVVPGLRTTILFSRCCSGGVQEGFYVEFGHGDEEAGIVRAVGSAVLYGRGIVHFRWLGRQQEECLGEESRPFSFRWILFPL